jgi:hypothetical protein
MLRATGRKAERQGSRVKRRKKTNVSFVIYLRHQPLNPPIFLKHNLLSLHLLLPYRQRLKLVQQRQLVDRTSSPSAIAVCWSVDRRGGGG